MGTVSTLGPGRRVVCVDVKLAAVVRLFACGVIRFQSRSLSESRYMISFESVGAVTFPYPMSTLELLLLGMEL